MTAPIRMALAGVMTLSLATPALAGITYTESTDGDLSPDRLNPTALTLGLGSNLLTGTFGATAPGSDTIDLDYVTVRVPAGLEFAALRVTRADVGGAFAFVGLAAGNQVTVPHTTSSAASLLGWSHFGTTSVGTDLFPEMSVASGAQGFTAPLGPGEYTFWIMELNTSETFVYGLDLQLTGGIVPSPDGLGLLLASALPAVRRPRRR